MKHSRIPLIGSVLLIIGSMASADDTMVSHGQTMTMMQAMDTNGDGKISKDEYMAYYANLWMRMKKDENGMIDAKSMGMAGGMMRNK